MKCERARNELKAYLDGELGAVTRMAVGLHVRRCPSCRAEKEALQMVADSLTSLPVPRPSEKLRQAVIGAARAQRASVRRRLRAWALAAVVAGGSVIALSIVFLARPTTALGAYQRMVAAAAEVKTCHMVHWMQPPGSTKRETSESWYDRGKWRIETKDDGKLITIQVYDGKMSHFYNPQTNTVTLNAFDQPFGTPFRGFGVSAMLEGIGSEAAVKLTKERGPDGGELSRFEATRRDERYVFLADPRTELPVEFQVYGRFGGRWQLIGGSDRIEYDMPTDPSLFVLTPPKGAAVSDKATTDAAWRQQYEAGMARTKSDDEEVVLRDFQVTSGGDAFAIWTGAGKGWQKKLTDSLGTIYIWSRGYGFQAGGDPCAWFVPVTPPTSRAEWYVLTVESGDEAFSFRVTKPVWTEARGPVYPRPSREPGKAAFITPGGDSGLTISQARIRAGYWRDKDNFRKAAQYYDQLLSAALADPGYNPGYLDPFTWKDIGSVYERAGMPDKAKDAYQRGLKSAEGSQYEEQEPQVLDELRAALKRLG